jgi:hypothetical protein
MSGIGNPYGAAPGNGGSGGPWEKPSALVSIGRGMTDMYEPIWSYLLAPEARKQYDAQRKTDEALYTRGFLGTTTPGQSNGAASGNSDVSRDVRTNTPDMWRDLGRQAIAAPMVLPALPVAAPEAVMSLMLTSGLYNAINKQRQRYGGLPDLPPTDWLSYVFGSSPSPK